MSGVNVNVTGVEATGVPPTLGLLLLESGFFLLQEASPPNAYFEIATGTVDTQASAAVNVSTNLLTAQAGSVVVTAHSNVLVTGVQGNGIVGYYVTWGLVNTIQNPAWTAMNTSQSPAWTQIAA
jgi:hypothetical protein